MSRENQTAFAGKSGEEQIWGGKDRADLCIMRLRENWKNGIIRLYTVVFLWACLFCRRGSGAAVFPVYFLKWFRKHLCRCVLEHNYEAERKIWRGEENYEDAEDQ